MTASGAQSNGESGPELIDPYLSAVAQFEKNHLERAIDQGDVLSEIAGHLDRSAFGSSQWRAGAVCLVGPAGRELSTLWCRIVADARSAGHRVLSVPVGVALGTNHPVDISVRLGEQLGPPRPAALGAVETVAWWMRRAAAAGPILVAIDSLGELDLAGGVADQLDLILGLGENVGLLLTTTDELQAALLLERGVATVRIPQSSHDSVRSVADRYTAATASSDPDDRTVATLIGALAISPYGLRPSDLVAIVQRAGAAPVRSPGGIGEENILVALDSFSDALEPRGASGSLGLCRAVLRDAAVSGWVSEPTVLHRLIAAHLVELPIDDPVRMSAAVSHALCSDSPELAYRALAGVELSTMPADLATRQLLAACRASEIAGAAPVAIPDLGLYERFDELDRPPERSALLFLDHVDGVLLDAGVRPVLRLRLLRSVLAIRRQAVESDEGSALSLRDLAASLDRVGAAEELATDREAMTAAWEESFGIRRRIIELEGETTASLRNLAKSLDRAAAAAYLAGDMPGWNGLVHESAETLRKLVDRFQKAECSLGAIADACGGLGRAEVRAGNGAEASDAWLRALAAARQFVEQDERSTESLRCLARSLAGAGAMAAHAKDDAEARQHRLESLEIRRELVERDEGAASSLIDLADALVKVSALDLRAGQLVEAGQRARESVECAQEAVSRSEASTRAMKQLADSLSAVRKVEWQLKNLPEAVRAGRAAHEVWRQLSESAGQSDEFLLYVRSSLVILAGTEAEAGNLAEALSGFREAFANLTPAPPEPKYVTDLRRLVAKGARELADRYRRRGRLIKASECRVLALQATAWDTTKKQR